MKPLKPASYLYISCTDKVHTYVIGKLKQNHELAFHCSIHYLLSDWIVMSMAPISQENLN